MMRYKIKQIDIACPCCNNDRFDKDYRQLNTKGATFLTLIGRIKMRLY